MLLTLLHGDSWRWRGSKRRSSSTEADLSSNQNSGRQLSLQESGDCTGVQGFIEQRAELSGGTFHLQGSSCGLKVVNTEGANDLPPEAFRSLTLYCEFNLYLNKRRDLLLFSFQDFSLM